MTSAIGQDYDRRSMGGEAGDGTKKSYTAPKGRPTRVRDGAMGRRRAFGPVAQWITFALALLVALVILLLVTDGGDFNPFDAVDDGSPAHGAVV